MTATYTFDVFTTLDGFGSYNSEGDWGGYWSKEGPEFVDHRISLYRAEQRLVLGANTFRDFMELLPAGPRSPTRWPTGCARCRRRWSRRRWKAPSTGRTRPS